MPACALHRYAPLDLADDYCRLGWLPSRALAGTHHGEYAVLMIWLCDCRPREPRR